MFLDWLRPAHLPPQVVQFLLQLGDRVRPGLRVLHHLGEEQRERGQRHLLLAPGQGLVQDRRLGPDHRRRSRRHQGHGRGRRRRQLPLDVADGPVRLAADGGSKLPQTSHSV